MNLGNKTKQLFLGTVMGFSLGMFFLISLTWAGNDEAVVDPILGIMPVDIVIVVTLAAVTASLSFYLGIVALKTNIEEPLPPMMFSVIASFGGILIVLASGLLNSQVLNTVSVITLIVNIPIFLTSFAWICASYIHNFLNSTK